MKQRSRVILSTLALLLCLCGGLAAYAQEPGTPAVPASKEPKVVTDLTGFDAFLRNAKAFTTNFGGPYRFAQADHKSAADVYGAEPAEGSVALLRIYTMSDDRGNVPVNTSGHAFISITNVSDSDLNVGGLLIAPGTCVTVGTRGNRNEHAGVWYNLESFYTYYIPGFYYNLYALQVSLDQAQMDTVNENLSRSDQWSAFYNCAAFSQAMWNSVCSDTLDAGFPYTPANLQANMLQRYPELVTFEPYIAYDYIVYYSDDLIPSEEFS